MSIRRFLLFALASLVLGCASDPPPPPACAVVMPLEVSEGAVLTLPSMADRTYTASDGLTVVSEGDEVRVYVDYGALTAPTITVSGMDCEPVEMPVTVSALEWTTLSAWDPSAGGPPGREYGAWWLSDDEARPGLYVFGGFHYEPRQFTPAWDLWFFDFGADTWEERSTQAPPMTPGGRVAMGPEPGSVVLHGGAVLGSDGSLDTPPVLQILRYTNVEPTWTEAPHAADAPGSYTGAFVRDERRDRWLSVCGVDARALGFHCQVSQYTLEGGWEPVEVAGEVPPGRYGFHYAYDEESDRIFVVGGQVGPDNLAIGGDAWALDLSESPARWVALSEDDDDVRRRNGAFVLDPIGRRLILWGGTDDGATSKPGLSILRIDPGQERWDHVEMPAEIPARTSGLAIYDAANQRAIMGFGNSEAVYTDLHALAL